MGDRSKALLFVGLLFLSAQIAPAQAPPPLTTGTPPFGTYSSGPIDVVNLGNLNAHLTIPILHKAGRGLPIDIRINSESDIWTISGGWIPLFAGWPYGDTNWYFEPLGWVQVSATVLKLCYGEYGLEGMEWAAAYTYNDASGTPHAFPIGMQYSTGGCGTGVQGGSVGVAIDGSGYSMTVSNQGANGVVIDKHGRQFSLALSTGQESIVETDTNGNQIAASAGATATIVTDTLGKSALTTTNTGSSYPVPTTFTYNVNGQLSRYTVKYTAYMLKTNFGCSGGTGEFGPIQFSLTSEIDLPDQGTNPSDKYTFTYEPTPGYPQYTTGRLASITLPSGGTISYTYPGPNDGINCFDGSGAELTRTTPDGTWTYVHSVPNQFGTSTSTTITDPLGNQTVVNFLKLNGDYKSADGFEIQRYVYQGFASSGTLLQTVYTCYDGEALPCTSPISYEAISQKSVYTEWANGQESESNITYDALFPSGEYETDYGLNKEQDEYDYGNGSPGSLLRKTLTSYANLNNGIVDRPSQVSVYDGSSNLKSQTNYSYDQTGVVSSGITTQHVSVSGSRGNPTTISRLVSGSAYLNQTSSYFDTGMVQTSTDPKGNPTTFAYSSSYSGAYPTTVTNALSQPTTYAYDINSGLITSMT